MPQPPSNKRNERKYGELVFRKATREEFNIGIEWAADEGWNPGLYDADIFWNTDPEGFVCIEKNSEIIGIGSTVSYKAFGFMGFFIVRKDLRNQGIGAPFWHWRKERLLSRLDTESTIGMDGVLDMQPFYAKGGFIHSHTTRRMVAKGKKSPDLTNIVKLDNSLFDSVKKMDLRCFGFNREIFLKQWIAPKNGIALGVLNGNDLSGFGVIRACREGFKIGPLFAGNAEDAEALYSSLSGFAKGENVYLDVPDLNRNAMDLVKNHQMEEVFACGRMYYGHAPELAWDEVYGITSFELG